MNRVEYITITVANGGVHSIYPESAQTLTAHDPKAQNGKHDIGSVVAKLAEYDYHLLDGSVVTGEVHPGGANFILFMQRTID